MKRAPRFILAFFWLTFGYWIVSFIVPLLLLFLPFARSSGGISTSASDGVYRVQFPGGPGDVIALLYVTQRGDKDIAIPTDTSPIVGSASHMQWSNTFFELFVVLIFAVISLPVLRRLLRNGA